MFIKFEKRKSLAKNKKISPLIENLYPLSRKLCDISKSAPELLTKHDMNSHGTRSLSILNYSNDRKTLESRMMLSRGEFNNMKAFHDGPIYPIKSEPSKNHRIRRRL